MRLCPLPHSPLTEPSLFLCCHSPAKQLSELGLLTRAGDRLHIAAGPSRKGFSTALLNGRSLLPAPLASVIAVASNSFGRPTAPAPSSSIAVRLLSARSLLVRAGMWEMRVENGESNVEVSDVRVNDWQRMEELRPEGVLGRRWTYGNGTVEDDDVEGYREKDEDLFGCNTDKDRFCHQCDGKAASIPQQP